MGSYRELAPPAALARVVACLWSSETGGADAPQPIVPDGCCDIVIVEGQVPVVAGPAQAVTLVDLPAHGRVIGLRFRPGMVRAGLGVSGRELVDRDVELADVWCAAEARELAGRVAELDTTEARLHVLAELVARHVRTPDPALEQAVRWLAAHPGRPVKFVAEALDLSERQLLRRFQEGVGYGPKTLQRVLRFQRLLALHERSPALGLGALAPGAGYLDQPHMTREVRALSGKSPSELLQSSFGFAAMDAFFRDVDARA